MATESSRPDGEADVPLGDRLAEVRDSIADAATRSGRDPNTITTIVVTKFQPISLVRELVELGVRDFGENRHQEAQPKARELARDDVTWHFVGQLQSKKARQVAAYADVIHSLDRESVIQALAAAPGVTECFVQLNLTDDPKRGGVADAELEARVEQILSTASLRLLGVMAVAPLDVDPRRAFERVREASGRVQRLAPDATAISAGMSHDYREAIAEGATHLRIGTAITGNRPAHG